MSATILLKTAKEAEKLLKAVGAKYYFQLPTGEEFGEKPKPPAPEQPTNNRGKPYTRTRRIMSMPGYKWGTRAAYIREQVKDMQVGEVVVVKMPDGGIFTKLEDLRKGTAGIAVGLWGNNAHKTVINTKDNAVEILRTA